MYPSSESLFLVTLFSAEREREKERKKEFATSSKSQTYFQLTHRLLQGWKKCNFLSFFFSSSFWQSTPKKAIWEESRWEIGSHERERGNTLFLTRLFRLLFCTNPMWREVSVDLFENSCIILLREKVSWQCHLSAVKGELGYPFRFIIY